MTKGSQEVINRRKWKRFHTTSDNNYYVNFYQKGNRVVEHEPVRMEVEKAAEKGENPGVDLEEVFIRLLVSLFTTVIHKVLRELLTGEKLSKLLGGKGSK